MTGSRHLHVATAAGLLLLLVSIHLPWFVDHSMRTFGPIGWVDCFDLPCSSEPDHLAGGIKPLGMLAYSSAMATAILSMVSLWRCAARLPAIIATSVCLGSGASFWLVATFVHRFARTIHDSEAGTRSTPPAAFLYFLAGACVLWSLRAPAAMPVSPATSDRARRP